MQRYFELHDPSQNHHKFWEIIVEGTTVNVHFGRIGTQGQTQVKTFQTAMATEHHVIKLIYEKKKKGYVEKQPKDEVPVHKPLTVKEVPVAPPPPELPATWPAKPRRRQISHPHTKE